ncbi:hypothetical protein YT1_3178 [Rhodococcus ruber]|nr:hypothetical protein YT1_3178 [Rhodococcus ruber]
MVLTPRIVGVRCRRSTRPGPREKVLRTVGSGCSVPGRPPKVRR